MSKVSEHVSEAQRTLSNDITLDIAIVVLASPGKATIRLERRRHHVVDQAVLVPQTLLLELRLILTSDASKTRTAS